MNSDTLFWNLCIFSIFNNCCRSFPLLPQREDSKLSLLAQDHVEMRMIYLSLLPTCTFIQTLNQSRKSRKLCNSWTAWDSACLNHTQTWPIHFPLPSLLEEVCGQLKIFRIFIYTQVWIVRSLKFDSPSNGWSSILTRSMLSRGTMCADQDSVRLQATSFQQARL